MPRYDTLRNLIGDQVRIRLLTYNRQMRSMSLHPTADLVMTWNPKGYLLEDRALALQEAVRPICSPAFAEAHADVLNGPVTGWSDLTFLEVSKTNEGWSSWEDWFRVSGRPEHPPRFFGFDDYLSVLEASAAGIGIALGWRHYIERLLETEVLIELCDGFVEMDNYYYCVITPEGRKNPLVPTFLKSFELAL